MPVPPLHERVLHAGVDAVALERPGRDRQVVEDVQDRHGDDAGDVEPDRDIEVPFPPLDHRAEEVDREDHPDHRDHDVDRPLEFGVFLGLRKAERKRDRRADDDELPAPEVDPAQHVGEHPGLQQPLRRVVATGEEGIAREGEDHGVGVQRPESPEAQERQPEVEERIGQLQRDQQPDQHPHGSPEDGREEELPHDHVIVTELLEPHPSWRCACGSSSA